MADYFIEDAFRHICKDAKPATGAYVCLMESVPYYGGPEEGGWWGRDRVVVAYQWFETEEGAEAAREAVVALAHYKEIDAFMKAHR